VTAVPQTSNYKFWLPPFNLKVWQDYVNQNFQVMDAVLSRFVAINNLAGVWTNTTAYSAGNRVVDPDDGTIYTCAVGHTSASSPTTFAQDRVAHPTYWVIFTFSVAFRGPWVAGTSYAVGDFVSYSKKLAVAVTSHVAGTVFLDDVAAGKWTIIVDGDTLTPMPPIVPADANRLVRVDTSGTFFTLAPTTVTIDAAGNFTVNTLIVSGALTVPALTITTTPLAVAGGGTGAATAVNARSNLGLVIGSNVQAWDADLDALAAIATTGGVAKRTGANTWSLVSTGATGESLMGAASAANAISTLGLQALGTSGATIPLNNTANTFSAACTFSALLTASLGLTVTNAGLQLGAPTGGDKGAGTINTAGDHYKNGVLVRGNHIIVQDQKASTTAGGTATSGAWQTRTLNTEVLDEGNDCTLAANQITLAAGTYDCRITAPASFCGAHQIRLRNVTDSSTILVGTSEVSSPSESSITATISTLVGRFTIAASKALEVQHRVTTTRATDGFGAANSFGEIEVYATAEFWRIT
jgi:hypothetical protein